MTATVEASYEALSPAVARAYRLLAHWPGLDLTIPAAAAALDTNLTEASAILDALAAVNLVMDIDEGRYRFRNQARDHARGKVGNDKAATNCAAASARIVSYYLHASAAADLIVLPRRLRLAPAFFLPAHQHSAVNDRIMALEWGDAEVPNLVDAQETAQNLGLHALAWQFADTFWGWLSHRQDYPAWETICQRALTSAQACADLRAQAFVHVRLANNRLTFGSYDDAWMHTNSALTAASTAGDYIGRASAHEHAGMIHLAEDRPEHAIAEFESALTCYDRAGGYPRGDAIIHQHLGRAKAGLGEYDLAAGHFQTALKTFKDLGETYERARTLLAMAQARLAADDPHTAIILLQQCLPPIQDQGHVLGLAETLMIAAEAYAAAGQPGTARGHLGEALRTYQRSGIPVDHPGHAHARAVAVTMGLLNPIRPLPEAAISDDPGSAEQI